MSGKILNSLRINSSIKQIGNVNGQSIKYTVTPTLGGHQKNNPKLIYAIGAVVGLIGGVKVYGKFSSGDPDTSKTAASWFGACIFLIVAATILRSFFL